MISPVAVALLFLASAASAQEPVAADETAEVVEAQPAFDFHKDFNIDFEHNLGDKWEALTQSLNGTTDVDLGQYFNLSGVATTPLGKIKAFVGDLVYPVALFGLALFAVYLILQIVFQVFTLAFGAKVSVFTAVLNWLGALNGAVFSKFSKFGWDDEAEADAEGERRKRGLPSLTDILYLADQVYTAIDKYQD